MSDPRLLRRLEEVSGRMRRWRALIFAAIGWGVLAIGLAILVGMRAWGMAVSVAAIGLLTIPVLAVWGGRRTKESCRQAALLIEKTYPELDSRLLTAMQQQPSGDRWNFSFLQTELLGEVFAQLRQQDWHRAVGRIRLWCAHSVHALMLCFVLVLSGIALSHARLIPLSLLPMAMPPDVPGVPPGWNLVVEPGNVDLERGTSLLVMARFSGQLPADVELVTRDSTGAETRVPLTKSLEDPFFGGRVSNVNRELTYRVEYAGEQSPEYTVTVFDYPELVQADAQIRYPDYTQTEPKTIPDVRSITLVEGSQLNLDCLLNKPVRSATLVPVDAAPMALAGNEQKPLHRTVDWTFTSPGERKYKLLLEDESGRQNRHPPEFRVTVLPNQSPDLKVAFPAKDLRVSSLQEVILSATASDDYGLKELGLILQTPDGQEQTVRLADEHQPHRPAAGSHLLALEQMGVNTDDLVSYYFYADDIGPDGQRRRSYSDMFFAEVRPFEEIFRQMSSDGAQGQSQSQQETPAGQLLESQRQIVIGIWNVMRREKQDSPSTRFVKDVGTLEESQRAIRELLKEVAGQQQDPLLQQFATQAGEQMEAAMELLKTARAEKSTLPLPPARSAAQEAYRSLLRLQAREHLLMQSQSPSQGQSSSSNRQMNQQLNNLQLKNDRNRYQSERQAQTEQAAAAQETQCILNQLRELAQRQADLNQQIRELESALQNAESEEQREELERQLKRLQEDQRELLRELDETREQMNSEQSRQQLQEARQQAESTRERVQRTSEALQQGQLSQALTEGTRAQRELQSLENDVRKKAAGQFNDAMRDLRDQTRDLSEKQQQIAEQMSSEPSSGATAERRAPSLRDASPDQGGDNPIAEELAQQKQQLTDVLDQARQLIQDSEASEPLLSKKLYDTLRELRSQEPEEALDRAISMSRRGIHGEARKFEEQAREGIDSLRAGVEQAARGILGDEETALRLAQAELSELTESIRRELEGLDAGNSPDGPGAEPATSPRPDGSATGSQPEPDAQGERNSNPSGQTGESPARDGAGTEQSPMPDSGNGMPRNEPASGQSGTTEGERRTPASEGNSASSRQGDNPADQNGDSSPQPTPSSERSPAGQQQGGQQQGGRQQGSQQDSSGSRTPSGRSSSSEASTGEESLLNQLSQDLQMGGSSDGGGTGGLGAPDRPLTGGSFREWSDRMRNVEEMLTTSELRSQAAVIRDRARLERIEISRHSKQPNQELVRTSVYGPLLELQQQIAEELARRNPDKSLVPIDREPVPEKYSRMVKEYYEQLSRQP